MKRAILCVCWNCEWCFTYKQKRNRRHKRRNQRPKMIRETFNVRRKKLAAKDQLEQL